MYLTLKRSTIQGSFFRNNSLTSFHPLLLKALLFSEIASSSSVPPPLPPPPLPSLSCFSFHMLVLFFLIFPLCKKWKAENRMSEGEKGRRQKQRLYISEITVCSAETVLCTDSGLQYIPKPHPYTSHSANQALSIDKSKCSHHPLLNYCIPMWYPYSMTRGAALISHSQLHKNTL